LVAKTTERIFGSLGVVIGVVFVATGALIRQLIIAEVGLAVVFIGLVLMVVSMFRLKSNTVASHDPTAIGSSPFE
jgi:uncharacterized membrane protein